MSRSILLITFFILSLQMVQGQGLIRVNNNADLDADFTNFADAVANASDNDTIYIEGSPQNYQGCDISKPLTIIGPGFFLGENPKTQANKFGVNFISQINFKSGSENSSISGCVCSNTYLKIYTDSIVVKRCKTGTIYLCNDVDKVVLFQNYILGSIRYDGVSYAVTNLVISNNYIRDNVNLNFSLNGPSLILNNIFGEYIQTYNATIQNNIFTSTHHGVTKNTNTISNNILTIAGTDADGNKFGVNMAVVFVGTTGYSTDGRWKLAENSPALGAGVGNIDCGIFGGPAPYVLSGIPEVPHIYEVTMPSVISSASGLDVSIKVKSGE